MAIKIQFKATIGYGDVMTYEGSDIAVVDELVKIIKAVKQEEDK